ncbi:hypothetical protein [Streptomyces sp. YGL11-2]|uniref:hypothetical protein n=1 Tax=Streptomyces sp. YGL11-2 TaxID=3414028 RepID=UPI003CF715E6
MDRGSSAMRTVNLNGVPDMLMWNLYHRAWEARRPRPVLHDPKAAELVDMLDYPFESHFGRPIGLVAQGNTLRVRTFDTAVREFLTPHPDGTIVQLAEGLETPCERTDRRPRRSLSRQFPGPRHRATLVQRPYADRHHAHHTGISGTPHAMGNQSQRTPTTVHRAPVHHVGPSTPAARGARSVPRNSRPLITHIGVRNALVLVTAVAQFASAGRKTGGIRTPPIPELAHVGVEKLCDA